MSKQGSIIISLSSSRLVSFPVPIAAGIPPVDANVTNTVALCPGYLGAGVSQFRDLREQCRRLRRLAPAAVAGGIVEALLLLNTGEQAFRAMIPFLLLLASSLSAIQDPLWDRLLRRRGRKGSMTSTEK